jgi:hypothetical protein
VDDDGYDF